MPLSFDDVLASLSDIRLASFKAPLQSLLAEYAKRTPHGNEARWDAALAALPAGPVNTFAPARAAITLGSAEELITDPAGFQQQLKAFSPWRKGPWQFFGTVIDTEWRSEWKWDRIVPHITALSGRSVLDVGCGNGYYLFRMLGAGAGLAIGVDPTLLYLYQFAIAKRLVPQVPAFVLPFKSEQLPSFEAFDTVFSLGVLYHRRSPEDHLAELMNFLRPGGELVLETLVVPGDATTVLVPEDRYAQMANVWSLPSTGALEAWLRRTGFENVRTVDVTRTTTNEQRATEWMTFQSLSDFLHPDNPDLTVEGLPAPRRAIVIANKPLR